MCKSHPFLSYITACLAVTVILSASSCQQNPLPNQCTNNIQDNGETGLDCGGPCPACGTQTYPDEFYFSLKVDGVQKYFGYSWYGYNSNFVHDGGSNDLEYDHSQSCGLFSAGPQASDGSLSASVRNIAYSCLPNNNGFQLDSSRAYFLASTNTFGNYNLSNPVKGLEIVYQPSFTSIYRSSGGNQTGSNINITGISQIFPADTNCKDEPYYIITGTVNCKVYNSTGASYTITDGHFKLINTF